MLRIRIIPATITTAMLLLGVKLADISQTAEALAQPPDQPAAAASPAETKAEAKPAEAKPAEAKPDAAEDETKKAEAKIAEAKKAGQSSVQASNPSPTWTKKVISTEPDFGDSLGRA